jgi:hypothetical protein
MHACMHTYMHTCIHAYMHIPMSTAVEVFAYTHMHMWQVLLEDDTDLALKPQNLRHKHTLSHAPTNSLGT